MRTPVFRTKNGDLDLESQLAQAFSVLGRVEAGPWTPLLKFGGNSVGLSYAGGGNTGRYYRIGQFVFIYAILVLTNKGSSTGNAGVKGLPFTVADELSVTTLEGLGTIPFAANMAGLTSAMTSVIIDTEEIIFYDWGSTGGVRIDDTNFTNSSSIRINGIYVTDEE